MRKLATLAGGQVNSGSMQHAVQYRSPSTSVIANGCATSFLAESVPGTAAGNLRRSTSPFHRIKMSSAKRLVCFMKFI